MKLGAALDLSGKEVVFAIADIDTGEVLVEEYKLMRGRDSAGLLLWLEQCVAQVNVKLTEIVEWTVGTGPGSFTGLRLVVALISGFTFQKSSVKVRTLPSVFALASINDVKDGQSIASLHDGRRSEVLLFGMDKRRGVVIENGDTRVLATPDELADAKSRYDVFIAVISEKPAIVKAFGEEFADTVLYVEHLPVSKLIFIESNNWGGDLTDLVYIRPAVFIEPRTVRKL